MIHLYEIDISIVIAAVAIADDVVVVDGIQTAVVTRELATDFEEHFDAVDEKEDEYDEQQECVAAAKKWRVRRPIFGDLCR